MMGAILSFMAMAVAGRELSAVLSTFQILFFRSVVGLAVVAVILSRAGWGQVRTGRPGLQVFRNLAHYIGQFGWFYGIALLPLAQVVAIEFTVPIWTAVLAVLVLGERLTWPRILAIAVGFAGILIILRPGLVSVSLASLAVLAAAVGYASSNTMTKLLTRTDTPLAILFYMSVVQLPLGFFPSLHDWVTPSPAMVPWIVVVGVSGLAAHYCMARAFLLADAIVVIPMDFLRLPLVAMLGYVLYGEGIDPWLLAGAVVIMGGNLLNIISVDRRRPDTLPREARIDPRGKHCR